MNCSPSTSCLAWVLLLSSLALPLSSAGCSGKEPSTPRSTAGGVLSGEVTERSEHASERPDWADESRPISREGETLRATGYVELAGEARLEMAQTAADSYARAELVKFLAARVFAVLKDRTSTGAPDVLRETIVERAGGYVDQTPAKARYWERRRDGKDKTLHVWSRVDLGPEQLDAMLGVLLEQTEGLGMPAAEIRAQLGQSWDELANPDTWQSEGPALPKGAFVPAWAAGGDQKTGEQFTFVCHGAGEDETVARALATRSCAEKLCRLFGVRIRAETVVKEDIAGMTATSEVSERCPEVRASGRTTLYQTGECTPDGCIYWIKQSYPRSAYLAEQKRLEQPTVIRQQVVIQEGDKLYKDPEQCMQALVSYGKVEGTTASAFEARAGHLQRALGLCQDIDSRDAGLFQALTEELTRPLPTFATTDKNARGEAMFRFVSEEFSQKLVTERFLTDRIRRVLGLCRDARLPLRLAQLDSLSEAEVEELIHEVTALPFTQEPTSPHHLMSVYEFALHRLASAQPPRPSRALDEFTLGKIRAGEVRCDRYGSQSGHAALRYFSSRAQVDAKTFQGMLTTLLASEADWRRSNCMSALFSAKSRPSARQLTEAFDLVLSGRLTIEGKSQVALLQQLSYNLAPGYQLEVYRRYEKRAVGPDKDRRSYREHVLQSHLTGYPSREHCPGRARVVAELLAEFPEMGLEQAGLCACLMPQHRLPDAERQAVVAVLAQHQRGSCNAIRDDEWPGGGYDVPAPKKKYGRDTPLDQAKLAIDEPIRECMKDVAPLASAPAYVQITATVSGARLLKPSVEARLIGKLRHFRFADDRPGLVQRSDLDAIHERITACVLRALSGTALPPDAPAARNQRSGRIRFTYERGRRDGGEVL